MIGKIAYTLIFGMPVVSWGGMVTLLLMLAAMAALILSRKGVVWAKFSYHPILGKLALIFGILHGIFSLLAFLGF